MKVKIRDIEDDTTKIYKNVESVRFDEGEHMLIKFENSARGSRFIQKKFCKYNFEILEEVDEVE